MNTARKIWSTLLLGLMLAGAWAMPAGAVDSISNYDGEGPRFDSLGFLESFEVLPGHLARRTMAEISVPEGTDVGRMACIITELTATETAAFAVGFSCDGLDLTQPELVYLRVYQTPLQDLEPEGDVSFTVPILLQCTRRLIPQAENRVECRGAARPAKR